MGKHDMLQLAGKQVRKREGEGKAMLQARPGQGKHTVPTRVNAPDKVLTIGPVSLTARQFLIVLIGSSIGYNLWHQLHMLSAYAPVGQVIRLCIALVPALLAIAFALAQIAGRPLEVWFFVLLRYCCQPRRAVWRSVRTWQAELSPDLEGEAGEAEKARLRESE
jgi:hypothetical protein